MNDPRPPRPGAYRRLLPALLMALATACGPSATPATEAPLAGATLGGPFALVDQDGKAARAQDFAGRYRIMYFGYTFCPDVCPTDVQVLMRGLKAFEAKDAARGARIQPIFVSVDPERDTPSALKSFVTAFHPRLIGLTGTPAQIADIARRYGVIYTIRKEPGAAGYLVDHTTTAILYGPAGDPIAILPQDKGADAVAAELDRWVR